MSPHAERMRSVLTSAAGFVAAFAVTVGTDMPAGRALATGLAAMGFMYVATTAGTVALDNRHPRAWWRKRG